MKPTRNARFERAWREMPDCVDTDPMAMTTIEDLKQACLDQLGLIEEQQDGTEDDDPRAIKRWLKKYGNQ